MNRLTNGAKAQAVKCSSAKSSESHEEDLNPLTCALSVEREVRA